MIGEVVGLRVAPAERAHLVRPIFIVSTPRSGSTLLFETLARAPGLFTLPGESHGRIERIADFAPWRRGWTSNRLTAEDASSANVEQLSAAFLADLTDRDGNRPHGGVRMVEKTPKNALRVSFFAFGWSDSCFIYLYRDVRQTLASMMEAWASGRFRTYPKLPGWTGYPWAMLLIPGWEELNGRPLPEIVARQWAVTTNILLDDLEALSPDRVTAVSHQAFVASPQSCIAHLTHKLGLAWDQPLGGQLPLSRFTVSRPDPNKWRRVAPAIDAVLPIVEQADARARALLERFS